MIHEADMLRLKKLTDGSSNAGEKINLFLTGAFKLLTSKIALVVLGVVLSALFFFLGLFGRKD